MRSKALVSFCPSPECNKQICLVETRVETHKSDIHDALHRLYEFPLSTGQCNVFERARLRWYGASSGIFLENTKYLRGLG